MKKKVKAKGRRGKAARGRSSTSGTKRQPQYTKAGGGTQRRFAESSTRRDQPEQGRYMPS